MSTPTTLSTLLADHGYAVLFSYVLLSQLGVPLPSGPLIMAAGALATTGRLRLAAVVAVVEIASLCADSVWYRLGRTQGARVLRALCRISLNPEVCVRRTRDAFGRYGGPFLLVAKFVPGLGLLAAPVAGERAMGFARFLVFDAVGVLAWTSSYALSGFFLAQAIGHSARLRATPHFGVAAVVGAALAVVAVRVVRNRRFRARTRTPRIPAVELKRRMDLGEPMYIVDLRPTPAAGSHLPSLPGAVHLTPDEVLQRADLIPKDREIVLFCDCPREASAALVAVSLQRSGFLRARPLEGGLEAWTRAGYPLEPIR